eukprot:CAMPEP_0118694750 /NCGR_PEP_ID=MMETSP0800-20121206/12743_1 /TAXON_ID=210618 ORGANISM="Striatella unipunctata, Strain CCMP2910" /NCGR_SAMPLE_ID=MMETSP0800 /ASSEMBLY_ACC=CAM_ASM_000638 /LENGTH=142 /DNA_ID=CAMNT_0006593343 /DNA_START=622 /DNA_END=1047 /DNA_ORIENTATION=+
MEARVQRQREVEAARQQQQQELEQASIEVTHDAPLLPTEEQQQQPSNVVQPQEEKECCRSLPQTPTTETQQQQQQVPIFPCLYQVCNPEGAGVYCSPEDTLLRTVPHGRFILCLEMNWQEGGMMLRMPDGWVRDTDMKRMIP